MIHKAGQKLVYPKEYAVIQQASSAAAWWSGGYAAYDAKGAASYAASLLDLTGNGRHAITGVQPGHTPGIGWVLNESQYLSTPIYPVCDQTWSAIIKFSGGIGTLDDFLFGLFDSPRRFNIRCRTNTNTHGFQNGGSLINTAGNITSGTLGFSGVRCFLDGLYEVSIPVSASTIALIPIFIGALNNAGIPASYYKGNISSFIVYDTIRSDAQMLATSTAMP